MLKRPPAKNVSRAPLEPAPTLAPAPKNYGASSTTQVGFTTRILDLVQLNPIREQPRIPLASAAQPIIRWGWRRFVQTHMTASPRIVGRAAIVGRILNAAADRPGMGGMPTRASLSRRSYSYPAYRTAPRVIVVGGDYPRRPAR